MTARTTNSKRERQRPRLRAADPTTPCGRRTGLHNRSGERHRVVLDGARDVLPGQVRRPRRRQRLRRAQPTYLDVDASYVHRHVGIVEPQPAGGARSVAPAQRRARWPTGSRARRRVRRETIRVPAGSHSADLQCRSCGRPVPEPASTAAGPPREAVTPGGATSRSGRETRRAADGGSRRRWEDAPVFQAIA